MGFTPVLASQRRKEVRFLTDPAARETGVLVAFCHRTGGASSPPFDTLNLAERVGDERAAVARNRRIVGRAVGFDLGVLALSRQVHGSEVLEVAPGRAGIVGEADGLVTRAAGPVLGMLTADCAAVVVAGAGGVVIVHAGWRGLVAGVVERGVAEVEPARAAWVGPCIRACCYEVGPEVVTAFNARGLPTAGSRVDVGEAAICALRRAGVPRIAAVPECTACTPTYFSHRRDGLTGRQGAFAALVGRAR
jgi:YfiH family protein